VLRRRHAQEHNVGNPQNAGIAPSPGVDPGVRLLLEKILEETTAGEHEIGHLLLGPNHTSSGIMRAVWGKTEYRDMAQRWLGFSAAERQALPRAIPTSDPVLAGVK
jgi:hypothetical protein